MVTGILKQYKTLILAASLVFLTSCALFRNPSGSFDKAVTKVNNTKTAIQANEDSTVVQAKSYIYAADYTLGLDPTPDKYNLVAKGFTSRSVITLGVPSMSEVNELRETVTNLLSTNALLVAKGQRELAARDAAVVALQKENENLQGKLEQAQSKVISVGEANSIMADKWNRLLKFFWWGVYIFLGMIAFRVLAAVLPPPYNSIVAIVALPFSLVLKGVHALIPEAREAAGWVGNEYRTATQNLVVAVNDLKKNNQDIHQEISDTVLKNSDTAAIPAINKAKSTMGITS